MKLLGKWGIVAEYIVASNGWQFLAVGWSYGGRFFVGGAVGVGEGGGAYCAAISTSLKRRG